MQDHHSGTCLCGTVRYEAHGRIDRFFLCHCSHCRKSTGSSNAANLFSSSATLDWLSGEDAIRTYRVPDTRHTKSFCSQCGSPVPTYSAKANRLMIPAGSLDTAVPVRPDAHIFMASKADWDDDLATVPELDGAPT